MNKWPIRAGATVACVNKRDGTLLKASAVSRMVGPAVVDPHHVMLGFAIDDWGVCIYLTLDEAAKLRADLDVLMADHAARA